MQYTMITDESVKITGDHSIKSIVCDMAVVWKFGDTTETYHALKRMRSFLPRDGSEKHPLTLRDMTLMERNIAAGKRVWQFKCLQGQGVREATGHDFVWGYGYTENGHFVFVDGNDAPAFAPIALPEVRHDNR